MANFKLTARLREAKGKEAAKKLRQNKEIPAVFYGPKSNPLMLAVSFSELQRLTKKSSGENVIIGLQIDSEGGSESRTVMLKELQVDPITDTPLHADFYEISMDQEITVSVPIHLIGTPLGVTNGGVLQHIRRELNISCLPTHLLEHLDLDVSEMEIGDALHVEDILLPEEVKPLDEGHLTVVVVAAPTVSKEEEEEEEGDEEALEEEAAESTEEATEETS